jgi:MFS family permease
MATTTGAGTDPDSPSSPRGGRADGPPLDAADLRHNLRWLYTGRALRSFATAFLTVVFPLYLAGEHLSSLAVGAILTAGGVASAGLMAVVGIAGDRFGRRSMLVGLGAAGVVGSVAMAATGNPVVLTVANGFGGVGRGGGAGSGGAWGPFFPAEQPLLAESVPAEQRTTAFGRISFVGVLAGAAGSLVAFVPGILHAHGVSLVSSYRLVFLFGALCSAGVIVVSLPLRERLAPRVRPTSVPERFAAPAEAPAASAPGTLSTRQLVGRLGLTNALNGLGFGFLGPLLTYWFHVRFGAGPTELAALYTVVNLVSALPYLGSAILARRLGAVRTVVWTRTVSVLLLLAMAAVPTFALAGLLFGLRMAVNSLSIPARQSFAMGVADERRRGTVAALGSLPSMVTASISPIVGGALMEELLATPLLGAALFMGANTIAYYLAFRRTIPPEERKPLAAPAPSAPAAGSATTGREPVRRNADDDGPTAP